MISLLKRIFLFFNSFTYFIYRNICDKINFFFRRLKKFEVSLDRIPKKSSSSDEKIKILMMDTVHQRLNIYTDCIIVEYLQNIFNCNITGILSKNDNQSKSFYKFIGAKANIELNEASIMEKLNFFFEAYNIVKNQNPNNVKKFIQIEIGGINLGRSVYDHLIRSTGRADHKELNAKFVNFLTDALYFENKFSNIFKVNTYDYLILSEVQFLPSNILIQVALKHDVKVLSRIYGPKKIGVRIYKNFNERFQSNHKISNKLFLELCKNRIDEYSKIGYKNVSDIFEKKTNNPDFYARHVIRRQNDFKNKFDLLKFFNWESEKKICTVFSHNMIDGNFYDEWKLFMDVKTWMEETLKIIREYGEKINWIIRPHPSEKYFPRLKTKTKDLFKEIIGESSNIKLCPDNCAPNTIRLLSDIVVTSHGSVGVEYPCFGIPSIICGDSYYRGNGFVNEPETIEEYGEMLKNLHMYIKKGLTPNQIKLARAFYYVHEYLIQIDCPLLDEKFDISDKENFDQFIKDANILRKKYNIKNDLFFKKFSQQINNNQSYFQ